MSDWFVSVGLFLGLASCACGAAAKRENSENFFESGFIPQIHIRIAETNLARLRRNDRNYVRATVKEGDTVYEEVGIHLKGAAGSHRPVDDEKPAFTLNFDKFVDHQSFHGLDKLSLNNSVQDGSYMTEAICSELFLAAGVPTARATHARVWLNGRDLGFYVLKEGFDKTFLKRHFKNVNGNLYDGGFLREITEPLELTSSDGDVRNRADLKALAAAAREPDHTKRLDRMRQVLDLDRFLSFAALEMLTWHWDGYVMKKNNYRVYHDPDSGKLVFFAHGMDQMFWDPNGSVVPQLGQVDGLVARALLETTEGQRLFRERAASLLTNVFTVERLTNHLNQLQARIRPMLEAISKDEARNHDNAVKNLRNQMIQRARIAMARLVEPEPMPVRFDASGVAALTKWQTLDIRGTGRLDQRAEAGGLRTLHVTAGPEGRCTASWRTRLHLPAGQYVFEGRLRTAGVVPLETDTAKKGVGAGLRQSQKQPRKHSFTGDNDWQHAEYEFTVPVDTDEIVLLCELRAEKGEAWFDLGSLKLRRK